tara:strand:+ start:8942 stop:9070 length:129 start_codon:yes stop_codon:yes gene_type:complete
MISAVGHELAHVFPETGIAFVDRWDRWKGDLDQYLRMMEEIE